MAQKMRAVRLFAPKDIRCVEVDVPHIEKDTQVLIKVKSCGVCGSDIPRVMVKELIIFPQRSDMNSQDRLWTAAIR